MTDPLFMSALLKVERAQQHIAALITIRDAFTQKPHNLGFYNESQEMVVEVRLREPIPTAFALTIGDAVHNLRTALDHATWELVGIDGGKQDRRLAFPSSRIKADYKAACRRI